MAAAALEFAAAPAAAQGLAAAAAALGPAVAACMCVVDGAGKAIHGGGERGAAQEVAPVRRLSPGRFLVSSLCWRAEHGTVCGRPQARSSEEWCG